MAFYDSLAEALQKVRVELASMVPGQNDPLSLSKKIGFLDAVSSQANGMDLEVLYNQQSQNGEYRGVQIGYWPRIADSDVVETEAGINCNPGNQWTKSYVDTAPTLVTSTKFRISERYVRQVVEGDMSINEFIQKHLMQYMRIMRTSIDKQLFTKAGTLIGANVPAGTAAGAYTDLELLKADNTVQYPNVFAIQNHMEDMMLSGQIFAVGLGNFRTFTQFLGVQAANDGPGIDFDRIEAQMSGIIPYRDQLTATALGGANRILAFLPGFIKPYTYNLYQDKFDVQITNIDVKTILPDPDYSWLKYDFKMKYDDNCASNGIQGFYDCRLHLYFDLFTIPDAAMGTEAALADVNGLFGYNITQEVITP